MSSRRATTTVSSRRTAKDETEVTPLTPVGNLSSSSTAEPSSIPQHPEPLPYYTQFDDLDYRQRKSRIFKMSASVAISLTLILVALLLVGSIVAFTTYMVFAKNKRSATTPAIYFAVVGDYGRQGKENQQEVGDAMAKWCATQVSEENNGKCNFLISTGDNFYDNGVVDSNDPLFKLSYEDVYSSSSMKGLTFYQVLGNHDYRGNPEAELDYQAISYRKNFVDAPNGPVTPYWYMPNYFYTAVEESKLPTSPSAVTGDKQTRVRILFIFADTSPFILSYYQDPKMNQTALQARSNVEEQMRQLKAMVSQFDKEQQEKAEENVKTYKILIGHHPIASGSIKHEDKDEMADYFVPLMKDIGANVYFCGHSHHLEYMRNETLHYFISGAGSRITGVKPHPLSQYQVSTPGFMFVKAFPDYITVHIVNSLGEEIHTVKLTNV